MIGVHWVPVDGWEGKNVNASGNMSDISLNIIRENHTFHRKAPKVFIKM